MFHQRNRKSLYKYLHKWKVEDSVSGFEYLSDEVISNLSPVSGDSQYLLANFVAIKDVDPDILADLPGLTPRNVKSLPYISTEIVSYVDNDPPT